MICGTPRLLFRPPPRMLFRPAPRLLFHPAKDLMKMMLTGVAVKCKFIIIWVLLQVLTLLIHALGHVERV